MHGVINALCFCSANLQAAAWLSGATLPETSGDARTECQRSCGRVRERQEQAGPASQNSELEVVCPLWSTTQLSQPVRDASET